MPWQRRRTALTRKGQQSKRRRARPRPPRQARRHIRRVSVFLERGLKERDGRLRLTCHLMCVTVFRLAARFVIAAVVALSPGRGWNRRRKAVMRRNKGVKNPCVIPIVRNELNRK